MAEWHQVMSGKGRAGHEDDGGSCSWAVSPLSLHPSLVLAAPPSLSFQRYFQWKVLFKGLFFPSLFFSPLDEKPKCCKTQFPT